MRKRAIALVSLAMLLATLWPASTALAHERRMVGKYQFIVGFLNEPAVQGMLNGVSLAVSVPDEQARPVEGLANTLKVRVAWGGREPRELALRARFGVPGAYNAELIPTRAGVYIFTFVGSIEGLAVNERFESGPGRFNDVEDVGALYLPEAPAAAGGDAAAVQVAQEVARAAQEEARLARAEASAAASQSLLVALGGVGVGAIALVLALVGLALRARGSPDAEA